MKLKLRVTPVEEEDFYLEKIEYLNGKKFARTNFFNQV